MKFFYKHVTEIRKKNVIALFIFQLHVFIYNDQS